MSYVDENYYNLAFGGKVNEEEISPFLQRASDAIDSMTYNRITGKGFNNLTKFQQDKIKKAVCHHAEFMYQYGEYLNSPLSGFSAGSISVSINTENLNGISTTSQVIQYLNQSGLTCRVI